MQCPEHFWHCPPQINKDSDTAAFKVVKARDRVAQTPDWAELDPDVGRHVLRALMAEVNAKWAATVKSEI